VIIMNTVRIGEATLPRIILGHLPFLGESYQGTQRNQEYLARFSDIENTIRIIMKALTSGVNTMAVTSSSSLHGKLLRQAIRNAITRTGRSLAILPCFSIPITLDEERIDDYRRWLTYYQYEQQHTTSPLLDIYLSDPILQCRPGWKTKFAHAHQTSTAYTSDEIARLQINYQALQDAFTFFNDFSIIGVEAGSESDFLVMTGRFDLLGDLTQFLQKTFHRPVFLGIHHAGTSLPLLDQQDLGVSGYLTPINKLGALMLPTQAQALDAITSTSKPVIAIKPLAGGRIPPNEAFDYVFQGAHADATMIGVASEEEFDEDMTAAQSSGAFVLS
jgi:hypothetical protein